jgi:endoglucanase
MRSQHAKVDVELAVYFLLAIPAAWTMVYAIILCFSMCKLSLPKFLNKNWVDMKFSRRSIIKGLCLAALSATSLTSLGVLPGLGKARSLRVHEVTMVLPDVIKIEIKEADLIHQGLGPAPNPPDFPANKWVVRNEKYALINGPNNNWYKYEDIRPTVFLNREVADNADGYGYIGDLRVTKVYRKTLPHDWGECRGDESTRTTKAVSMRHCLYLQLSGDLPQGAHKIVFPKGLCISPPSTLSDLEDFSFTFNDKTTRFAAIKSNQFGHALSDLMKYAYLAEWIPGYAEEGRVSFFFLIDWHIIDDKGKIVWSAGRRPALRVSPTDVEFHSAIDATDVRLTSTTQPIRNVTGYTISDPCVVSYEGPDLENDTVIRFENVMDVNRAPAVMNSVVNVAFSFKVKNVDNSGPKTFQPMSLDFGKEIETKFLNTSGAKEWLEGGIIYETNPSNNRAGTYVYGLDYSSFSPVKEGLYRIHVEGLGVSHPFHMDNAVWHHVAANMAAGEYHHRHAIPLDGRFGYSRPAGFSPTAQVIYQNLLPLYFSVEVGQPGTPVTNNGIVGKTNSPMHTGKTVNYVPGHHDAGDHDSRLGSHALCYYGLMDFYDQFPQAAAATKWNIPKMTELYPSDSRYAGTETLPDCMQQALFALHGYIHGVSELGEVSGGLNWSSSSGLTPSWLVNSGGPVATDNTVFVYGPDHVCGYIFSGLLAKMAICLQKSAGFESLAKYYGDLAKLCWDRAELVFDMGSDWSKSGSEAVLAARTKMYDTGGTVLPGGYKTVSDSLQPGAFEESFAHTQKIIDKHGLRLMNASLLYRMTGDIQYGNVITEVSFNNAVDYTRPHSWALYEYINCTYENTKPMKQAEYKKFMHEWCIANILSFMKGDIGFKSLKRTTTNGNFGADGTDWSLIAAPLVAMYVIRERDYPGGGEEYRKALEDGWHYGLGANLLGKSLTTGLGTDVVTVALHNDSAAMGVPVPKGMMLYGPGRRTMIMSLSFKPHSPLNYLTMNSSPSYTTDFEHYRSVYPTHFAWPRQEHFFESPGMIEMVEYVFGGSIGPQQWVASVLWAGGTKLSNQLFTED